MTSLRDGLNSAHGGVTPAESAADGGCGPVAGDKGPIYADGVTLRVRLPFDAIICTLLMDLSKLTAVRAESGKGLALAEALVEGDGGWKVRGSVGGTSVEGAVEVVFEIWGEEVSLRATQ